MNWSQSSCKTQFSMVYYKFCEIIHCMQHDEHCAIMDITQAAAHSVSQYWAPEYPEGVQKYNSSNSECEHQGLSWCECILHLQVGLTQEIL